MRFEGSETYVATDDLKLAVNAVVFGLNQTLAESLVLAEKAGVDRELAYEVFGNSAVAAPYVKYKRSAFEHPESTPVAFALDLVAKDLALAADLAAQVGASVPQLDVNREVALRAIEAGLGDADMSAIDLSRTVLPPVLGPETSNVRSSGAISRSNGMTATPCESSSGCRPFRIANPAAGVESSACAHWYASA